jgi:hypothetical protein
MEGYQMFTIFVPKKTKVAEKKPAPAVEDKKAEKAEKPAKKPAAKPAAVEKDDDEIF